MSRGEKAYNYFNQGYNCAQAVVLAFGDLYPEKVNDLIKVASSFGGGFGRLREVCGAFSGLSIVAGVLIGFDGENDVSKAEHYAFIRDAGNKFKEINGSLICRELLGGTVALSSDDPTVRTEEYKKKRPCAEMCRCAAEILEQKLTEIGKL